MTEADHAQELRWLRDLLEAIDKIQNHPKLASGKEALEQDEHFMVWVLYFIERVGECASNLRRKYDYDKTHPEIDWKGAVGMRRHIAHTYWDIDLDQVWEGIEYLLEIRPQIAALIESLQDR